jgi:hypothetical protein
MGTTLFPKTQTLYQIKVKTINGVYKEFKTEGTFSGSIQPITGKELETIEVGREDRGKVKVYSSTKLNVGEAGKDYSGDVVVYDGREWEIIHELSYLNDLISHYKYIAEYRKEVS